MTTIDVFQTWQDLMTLVNVQQNGQIPPSVFQNWYNQVNKQVFKDLAEEFQTNQILSDLLMPFRKIAVLPVVPQQGSPFGLVTLPADYEYFVSAQVLSQQQEEECFSVTNLPKIDGNGKAQPYTDPDYAQMVINFAGANIVEDQCQMIDAQRWAGCLTHATKAPSLVNPKMTQFAGGLKVAPKGVSTIVLYYLSTPKDAVFSYTISSDDIAIYNAGGSQQLQWSVQVLPKFLAELQKKYASYVDNQNIYQMGVNDQKR
jgi:hypothetical protein